MGSSLILSLFLLSAGFWQFVAANVVPVTVEASVGSDITLPCKTTGAKVVVQVEWARNDEKTAPVLLFKENKVDANQLAAYKGRVSLVKPGTGDVSLLLKKVVEKDAGKYECRVEEGADIPGGVTPAPGGGKAPGAVTPAPGAATPAPGAATPAPGAATPAPGAATPAPGAVTPAPGADTPVPGKARKQRAILKSNPIAIVELKVKGGSVHNIKPVQPTPASHAAASLRPNGGRPAVLLGLLGLLVLTAGLQ